MKHVLNNGNNEYDASSENDEKLSDEAEFSDDLKGSRVQEDESGSGAILSKPTFSTIVSGNCSNSLRQVQVFLPWNYPNVSSGNPGPWFCFTF